MANAAIEQPGVAAAPKADIAGLPPVDAPHSDAAAEQAVACVQAGEADRLRKGNLHTDERLAAIARREGGLRTVRRLKHRFVMDVPGHATPLIITDAVRQERTMETLTPQTGSTFARGDTPFMSATDLATYAARIRTAQAKREREGLDRADKAQADLIRRLADPVELTPQKAEEITATLLHRLRVAAEQGRKELQVMRFPNALCTDGGRAITNVEADWPVTLTGRPRQAFEFWRDRLQPSGYGLRAMIVDWPHGLPGDVAFFLTWDAPQP